MGKSASTQIRGDFINKLIHSDKLRARKYHGAYRFIDDQCCINDSGDFGKSFREIYPPELELKVENQGNHATFLDLDHHNSRWTVCL